MSCTRKYMMVNWLLLTWFIIFGEGLSIGRFSHDGTSDLLRFERSPDYYSGNINYDYLPPELPFVRPNHVYPMAPQEQILPMPLQGPIYPMAPQEQLYQMAPHEQVYPILPQEQALQNAPNERSYYIPSPINTRNMAFQQVRDDNNEQEKPSKSYVSDEGTEVILEFPNGQNDPVVKYFVPSDLNSNVHEKRNEEETPDKQKYVNGRVYTNSQVKKSEQVKKYEEELETDLENEKEEENEDELGSISE